MDRLVADCMTLFSARSTATSGEHSTGSTYWFDPEDSSQPRCLLEQFVQAIFRAHAPKNLADRTKQHKVGAEWWTLAIDAVDASVGFHWDLDYHAADAHGLYRTPYAGTVTYLSQLGAPTLVLDKWPVTSCREWPPDDGKPIKQGWLSFPAPGKHIRFPGACLHGAPDLDIDLVDEGTDEEEDSKKTTNMITKTKAGVKSMKKKGSIGNNDKPQKKKGSKRKNRISLLVNVWIDGAPDFASPLSADIAAKLTPCMSKVPFSLEHPSSVQQNASINDSKQKGKKSFDKESSGTNDVNATACEYEWPVATMSDRMECSLHFSDILQKQNLKHGSTVTFNFRPGGAMLSY